MLGDPRGDPDSPPDGRPFAARPAGAHPVWQTGTDSAGRGAGVEGGGGGEGGALPAQGPSLLTRGRALKMPTRATNPIPGPTALRNRIGLDTRATSAWSATRSTDRHDLVLRHARHRSASRAWGGRPLTLATWPARRCAPGQPRTTRTTMTAARPLRPGDGAVSASLTTGSSMARASDAEAQNSGATGSIFARPVRSPPMRTTSGQSAQRVAAADGGTLYRSTVDGRRPTRSFLPRRSTVSTKGARGGVGICSRPNLNQHHRLDALNRPVTLTTAHAGDAAQHRPALL